MAITKPRVMFIMANMRSPDIVVTSAQGPELMYKAPVSRQENFQVSSIAKRKLDEKGCNGIDKSCQQINCF